MRRGLFLIFYKGKSAFSVPYFVIISFWSMYFKIFVLVLGFLTACFWYLSSSYYIKKRLICEEEENLIWRIYLDGPDSVNKSYQIWTDHVWTDIRWTDSSTRTDHLNEPVVDRAFVEESKVDGPRVDGPKKPRGTRLIIMWTPKNPKWK